MPVTNTSSVSQLTLPRIEGLPGAYHSVIKGQTLWRISRIYSADLDELIRVNNISDITQLYPGQKIFIPHAIRPIASRSRIPAKDVVEEFIWPVKGKVLSIFGEKSGNMVNKGINMRISPFCEVVASRSGTVVFTSDDMGAYGKTIIIEHKDGFMTVYSLISHILVKVGEYITQGMSIAKAEKGIVHFEIRKGHVPQNPYYYLSS